MPTLGPLELVIILVIVAMLFGVGKLPEVFGAVGKGVREFRTNAQGDDEPSATTTVEKTAESAPAAAPAPAPAETETTQTT
jgi:sec-independent protein translocase protein TatA